MTAEPTVFLFWVFALMIFGCSLAVVFSQNVVRMAFWLILALGSTAALFFLLHADFVAAVQLLIYVGGTVVLLIFGVMLTATGPFVQMKTSPAEAVLSGAIALAFLVTLAGTFLAADWSLASTSSNAAAPAAPEGFNPPGVGNTLRPIGFALLGSRIDKDLTAPAGNKLSTGYLLVFEIISIHLLVVLVGAAYLARAKRYVKPSART